MKICITAQGATPDTKVEERFGRAPYFILMDRETGSYEAIANPFADGAGGVGPKAAQLILDRKAEALVSGLLGGNAKAVLDSAGVTQYTYRAGGSVRDAFDAFRNNTLERAE
ncbi:MAG: NifB/NifX family molybdenum-iron cluster-binding protein [Methanoregula sp.]|nr:NifB/NifX family molybdenum-iron cluster-binding protein [Methanoregula sp.]